MQEKNNEQKSCDEEFQEEITSKDYGFIVSDEGELKAVFMPTDNAMFIPASVKRVFKIFGIKNPDTIDVHTVH